MQIIKYVFCNDGFCFCFIITLVPSSNVELCNPVDQQKQAFAQSGTLLKRGIMEVFLQIRRKNTTLFLDTKASTTVYKLKQMIEGILKVPPESQVLFEVTSNKKLQDESTLADCSFSQQNAKAQEPAQLNLAVIVDGVMESIYVEDYSMPPELPDVMKPHDGASTT